MDAIGRKRWAIAEGYIPGQSHGPAPELESHEACCVLNAGDAPAHCRHKQKAPPWAGLEGTVRGAQATGTTPAAWAPLGPCCTS